MKKQLLAESAAQLYIERQIVIYILKIEELAQTNGYKKITKQELEF